jgi:hypothetical protein
MSPVEHTVRPTRKPLPAITWVILFTAILAAVWITALDMGSSGSGTSGAGDIWWVGVPEVEQSYRRLAGEKQNYVFETGGF